MAGKTLRFLIGPIVGVVVATAMKAARGVEGPSEGVTTG
jgi:hypothetical protein